MCDSNENLACLDITWFNVVTWLDSKRVVSPQNKPGWRFFYIFLFVNLYTCFAVCIYIKIEYHIVSTNHDTLRVARYNSYILKWTKLKKRYKKKTPKIFHSRVSNSFITRNWMCSITVNCIGLNQILYSIGLEKQKLRNSRI